MPSSPPRPAPTGSSRALAFAALTACTALAACGHAPRFPLRPPLTTDTDLRPVSVKCAKRPTDEDKAHVACAPVPYVSPLAWDAADNTVFRPLAKVFAVDPPGEAVNVNAFDEVADSAWFTNRLGVRKPSREELLRGACRPEDLLDPTTVKEGEYLIDQGKPNGASPGFRIRTAAKKKYMFKTDFVKEPERPSAAAVIGTAVYHAIGFNTSCEQILYVDPTRFTLKPGLKVTANDGITRPFDEAALKKVLDGAVKRDALVRFQASAWLPGYLLGPFKYEGTRKDDPNDVIPHEERRELRGGRVLAAWLHHFDAREQNSMDSWIATDKAIPDSSPGFVRHYYLDTSDCLGSEWDWDGVSRRMGDSYLLDFADIGTDFVTLGAIERPWERKKRQPGMEIFGYFHWEEFDPDRWRNEYPNPAFGRASEHDNAWMARILSRLDREDIQSIVTLGKFSNPAASDFLTEILEQRLRKILDRYLLRLSPIADLAIDASANQHRLCGTDLARRRGVRPESAFRYGATVQSARGSGAAAVEPGPGGALCVPLGHVATDGGVPDDDASRYVTVTIANGAARGALVARLYDLGPTRGFTLVGIERPNP